MRDDGAENTSNVTGHEGHTKLGALAVARFWLGEDVGIEGLDDSFEGDEFDNGVWNLSAPEWGETLVESVGTLSSLQVVETGDSGLGELAWLGSLHFDLKGFPWAEETISNDL